MAVAGVSGRGEDPPGSPPPRRGPRCHGPATHQQEPHHEEKTSGFEPESFPSDHTPAGAVAATPRRRHRGRIALISFAGLLALAMIITLALPAGREGVQDLWCEITGGVCSGEAPPITEEEQAEELDWRMPVEPEEAALWGNYVALGDSYSSGDGA